MWPFSSVTNRAERSYLLAYWRYLLGWQEVPSAPASLRVKQRIALRRMARSAVNHPPRGPAKLLAFPEPQPKTEIQK